MFSLNVIDSLLKKAFFHTIFSFEILRIFLHFNKMKWPEYLKKRNELLIGINTYG